MGCNKNKLYLRLLSVGVLLNLIAIGLSCRIISLKVVTVLNNETFRNVCIAIGSGLMTSVLVAYLCEKNGEKMKRQEQEEVKRNILVELKKDFSIYFGDECTPPSMELLAGSYYIIQMEPELQHYVVMGIKYCNTKELRYLIKTHGFFLQLKELMLNKNLKGLYERNEDVFNEVVNWDFTVESDANERRLQSMCSNLEDSLSESDAKTIVEFIDLIMKCKRHLGDSHFYYAYI